MSHPRLTPSPLTRCAPHLVSPIASHSICASPRLTSGELAIHWGHRTAAQRCSSMLYERNLTGTSPRLTQECTPTLHCICAAPFPLRRVHYVWCRLRQVPDYGGRLHRLRPAPRQCAPPDLKLCPPNLDPHPKHRPVPPSLNDERARCLNSAPTLACCSLSFTERWNESYAVLPSDSPDSWHLLFLGRCVDRCATSAISHSGAARPQRSPESVRTRWSCSAHVICVRPSVRADDAATCRVSR
jgi:hypothetical protein